MYYYTTTIRSAHMIFAHDVRFATSLSKQTCSAEGGGGGGGGGGLTAAQFNYPLSMYLM